MCGYDRSLRALSFDHTEPSVKTQHPQQVARSGQTIFSGVALDRAWPPTDVEFWEEFDSCELVCANCHMENEERRVYGNTDWKSDIDPAIYAGLQAWHERVGYGPSRCAPKRRRKKEVANGK